jgi:hypothetical protein
MTMSKIIAATLSTNSTALAMVISLFYTFRVKKTAFRAEVTCKLNAADFALFTNLIKLKFSVDLQVR